MEKYGDNDYVVDDDIVKKASSIIYEIHNKTFSNKTSDKLLKPFNPSKPFKIRCAVTFNNFPYTSYNLYTGFIIIKDNVNLTCVKAQFNHSGIVSGNSYWFSGDQLGEFHYGTPANGVKFIYEFSYNGDNRILEDNAIANLTLKYRDEYSKLHYPRNLESDTIYFCYDPRILDNEVSNLHFDYLIIEQE